MSKKDLTQFCRETNETHKSVSEKEFRHIWCKRCRNQECRFSQWGDGLWINRMETQVDRLLENPLFGDPRQEQFRHLQDITFEDMKQHAVALHLSSMNSDWEIPSEKQVNDFIENPHLETDFSVRQKSEMAISNENSQILEEKEPLKNEIHEEGNLGAASSEEKQLVSTKPNLPPTINTPISDEGIMIGGDEPMSKAPNVEVDEWSVPPTVENIIPIGGRVVMGNKGDKK